MKHGRFAPFVSFRPGCCRVPVCLIYEPARRRIANTMVVNIGKNQFKSFLLHKVSILALSVIAARCQIPPFVAARHLPPAGGSRPSKWEPLAVHANFISLPRPLPLGEVDANKVSRRRGRGRRSLSSRPDHPDTLRRAERYAPCGLPDCRPAGYRTLAQSAPHRWASL